MDEGDDDFLARLQAAALRARASGFDATATAIEEIIAVEFSRRKREELARSENDPTIRRVGD